MTELLLPAAGLAWIALAVYGAGAVWVAVFAAVFARRTPHASGRETAGAEEIWLLGFVAWAVTLFSLASLGGLRQPLLLALLAMAGLAGLLAIGKPKRPTAGNGVTVSTILAFAAPLVAVFAVTVNPTVSWDGAVYHLTLPQIYLEAGGFRTVPMLVYSVWPQAVELFFTLGLALQGYVLAKAMHFGFGCLVAVLLVRLAGRTEAGRTRLDGPRPRHLETAGLLAAALFLLHDVVLFEMRAAYVDLAMACFVLLAFHFVDRALDAAEMDSRDLVLAGFACGLLAATKINGVVSALCVGAMFLPRFHRASPRTRWRLAACIALPMLALWLPWLARSWGQTGNPFYPLLWDVFGGPDWNAALTAQLVDWQRSIGMGRGVVDWLLLPWRVFTSGAYGYESFDGRLSPLWLPFLPLALWGAWRCRCARRALCLSTLLFVAWALGSQQIRFLVPALPLLALAIASGFEAALEQFGPGSRRRARALTWIVVGAWLLAFATTQPRLLRAGWSHLQLYADSRFQMPSSAPRPPVFDAIATLPADSKVLLLNSNQLFHCERTCLADSFFEASQISGWLGDATSADEVARRLRQRGVTHVAWSGRPLGVDYPESLTRLLDRADLATQVFVRHTDRLWMITP